MCGRTQSYAPLDISGGVTEEEAQSFGWRPSTDGKWLCPIDSGNEELLGKIFGSKTQDWSVPKEVQEQTWSVIVYPDCNVVVPTTDIAPHEIESANCPCKPRVELEMIVHNSWRDLESIDSSLKNLF